MAGSDVIYFTPEEFLLMMEFSGGGEYVLFREEKMPEREDILQAAFRLYRRKYIREEDGKFLPEKNGLFFKKLHDAPWAVLAEPASPEIPDTAFYPAGADFYMVEYLQDDRVKTCRLSTITRPGIRAWLTDAGVLDEPFISDGDTEDLNAVFAAQEEDGGDEEENHETAVTFRKTGPGGLLLEEAEVFRNSRGWFIRTAGQEGEGPEWYTTEALERMLDRCFGKEQNDHR